MPSKFATDLCEIICNFNSISASQEELESLAKSIDYQMNFLPEFCREDLEPLLFLECGSESKTKNLSVKDIQRLLGRVQKRVYRDFYRPTVSLQKLVNQKQDYHLDPVTIDRVLNDFKEFIKFDMSLRDSKIFELHYIKGCKVEKIGSQLGIKTSTTYESLNNIRDRFKKFLDDVIIPGIRN